MRCAEAWLVAVNRALLIGLLAAMSVIVFANVVLRYTTSESIGWAEEVARHLMVWLTFVGIGPVLRYGGHIAIDNLQDSLPGPLAAALRGLIAALLFGFAGVLVWYGLDYMDRTQYQLTPATQVPMSWIYAAMPVGGVLMALHWLFVVRGYVTARRFAADAGFDATASASL